MTRETAARRIAEVLFKEPATRRGAGAALTQRVCANFGRVLLLLVGQRPQRVFSVLAPRAQPKFAAALLYGPQTWYTKSPDRRHPQKALVCVIVRDIKSRRPQRFESLS